MSKWITGKELIERWDILPLQIVQYLMEGLQPYNKFHGMIIPEALHRPSNPDDWGMWWIRKMESQDAPDIWEDYIYLMNNETREQFLSDLMNAYYLFHDVERIEQEFHLHPQKAHNGSQSDREPAEKVSALPENHPLKVNEISKLPKSDKQIVRAYAKGVLENEPSITRTALADRIKKQLPEGSYEPETLIEWIRDLFPDYTPLKPGRKPRK
jgi:hypothetical protein